MSKTLKTVLIIAGAVCSLAIAVSVVFYLVYMPVMRENNKMTLEKQKQEQELEKQKTDQAKAEQEAKDKAVADQAKADADAKAQQEATAKAQAQKATQPAPAQTPAKPNTADLLAKCLAGVDTAKATDRANDIYWTLAKTQMEKDFCFRQYPQ